MPIFTHTLGHVLVRGEDDHTLHPGMLREASRRRGETIVRLELDHGPDDDAQRTQGVLQQGELREQLGRHALVGLVARVTLVAPGVDDVVGGAAEVGHALVAQQRQDRLHDAEGRGYRLTIEALVRRPPEVRPEELVGAVEQVDLHAVPLAGRRPLG